ncbi:hypothetical protein BDZ85DRAFT_262440 [Elsinoe ampelina]|uniref:EthD domain-containing protein n=1 Tax=Elsinoe ampelina TaxID=302913 RepID=A0A6A6GAZ7_9PEZI|nr:hypothetical protein BDZ85DRAFT_262440 [Elsinoe ampelina]
MAPITFHLVATSGSTEAFLAESKKHLAQEDLLYIGRAVHWMHEPHLSVKALLGTKSRAIEWQCLVATQSATLPDGLREHLVTHWSISSDVDDNMLKAVAAMAEGADASAAPASFPGWNANDHTGLDAATPVSDLEVNIDMPTRSLGSDLASDPTPFRDFVRTFGAKHTGPVHIFNLLSYLPGQRDRYMQYVAAFQKSVGSTYGGTPELLGFGVVDWSSKAVEEKDGQQFGWEDTALIKYPSIWHFSKMIDSPEYASADRDYKQGVIRDNALLCVTPLSLD